MEDQHPLPGPGFCDRAGLLVVEFHCVCCPWLCNGRHMWCCRELQGRANREVGMVPPLPLWLGITGCPRLSLSFSKDENEEVLRWGGRVKEPTHSSHSRPCVNPRGGPSLVGPCSSHHGSENGHAKWFSVDP